MDTGCYNHHVHAVSHVVPGQLDESLVGANDGQLQESGSMMQRRARTGPASATNCNGNGKQARTQAQARARTQAWDARLDGRQPIPPVSASRRKLEHGHIRCMHSPMHHPPLLGRVSESTVENHMAGLGCPFFFRPQEVWRYVQTGLPSPPPKNGEFDHQPLGDL